MRGYEPKIVRMVTRLHIVSTLIVRKDHVHGDKSGSVVVALMFAAAMSSFTIDRTFESVR